jgi:6-phosphogluconolactonase
VLQIISALPEGATPNRDNNMGNAHIKSNGQNVYATTRSDDSITTFAVSEGGARLTYIQHVPSGGGCPVHFGLDPNGGYLWCVESVFICT